MSEYMLKFLEDENNPEKEIRFTAEDAGSALIFAHGEAAERSAELWRDGEQVCTIRRPSGVLWQILPPTY